MALEREKPEERETKIPVFSVLKNGILLKNIFLNYPPVDHQSGEEEREEDLILIGRHPDCHVVLDHPSISRFHLEVRANSTLQKLSVTDRSSVHGTWVSGTKIQPNFPTELMEGETVKLGASTREYRLQWILRSRAFETENPLPALLEEPEETHQMENLNWTTEIPSAPPMPDSMNFSSPRQSFSVPLERELENTKKYDLGEGSLCYLSPELESFSLPLEREIHSPFRKELGEESSSLCSSVSVLEPVGCQLPLEKEYRTPESNRDNDSLSERVSENKVKSSSLLSRRSKSISFLQVNSGKSEGRGKTGKMNNDAAVEDGIKRENSVIEEQGKREETFCRVLFVKNEEEEGEETFASDKENMTPVNSISQKLERNVFNLDKENSMPAYSSGCKLQKSHTRLKKSSLNAIQPVDMEEDLSFSDKENWTPGVTREVKKLIPGDLVKYSEEQQGEEFPSDKENLTPAVSGVKKLKQPLPKGHTGSEREMTNRRKERVPFQSLFENSPSNSNKSSNHCQRMVDRCSNTSFNHCRRMFDEGNSSSQDADQVLLKGSGVTMTTTKERAPFQSPLENSTGENAKSVIHQRVLDKENDYTSFSLAQELTNKLSNTLSHCEEQGLQKAGEKKRWNIVVDTSCFLDEESRKSLQLLEGLRGTHLIIPRMVIRELDCLKRSESFFRKGTKASSVLEWIEECMERSSWWIHVQSSMETMPVAPTPPATPRSQFDGSDECGIGSSHSMGFSTCGSLMEIVSPTVEDHILDCALMFRRIREDGQLVLLTRSTTLKIKAMAEGVLSETPKEFRESLVNPYSKRFLWADSSPRGSTWSCLDDFGLTENYYQQFPGVRKATKTTDGVKGLKLILLHNSQYGKTNLVK